MSLSRHGQQSVAEAEKATREFGDLTEFLYSLAVDTLASSSTLRFGIRYHFLAPADSLEEADRIVCSATNSPIQQRVGELLAGMELVDSGSMFVFEDSETGVRRLVSIISASFDAPGGPEPQGFRVEKGTGGVLVDIDTYTRPPSGHLPHVSMFVQEQFLKARKTATALLKWIVQLRK